MTETVKHTPGPWSANSDVDSPWTADLDWDAENPSGVSTCQPIIGANDQTVCLVVGVGWQDDELDANARLIAAAPELLDALRSLQTFLRGANRLSTRGAEIEIDRLCRNAEAALAKAASP